LALPVQSRTAASTRRPPPRWTRWPGGQSSPSLTWPTRITATTSVWRRTVKDPPDIESCLTYDPDPIHQLIFRYGNLHNVINVIYFIWITITIKYNVNETKKSIEFVLRLSMWLTNLSTWLGFLDFTEEAISISDSDTNRIGTWRSDT